MATNNKLDKVGLSQVWTKITGNFVAKVEGKDLSTNDYTDEEKEKTLYTNQTPSTVAVGGVEKGYVPPTDGVEAVELLNKLLHAYVAPTVTAAMTPTNGGTVEAGTTQTVTGVTVTITLGSAEITKIEVLDGSTVIATKTSGIAEGANAITFGTALSVTANKQLTVNVTDADGEVVTAKTGTYSFVSPYYYGAVSDGVEITEALITSLTKSVSAKGTKSFNFTCSNQKMLLAYPKSYGALAKILDANSFDVTSTFTSVEVSVGGVAYYAYTNDPSTVSAFKMTFSY